MCGILATNGTIECWGTFSDVQGQPTGQATPPPGKRFSELAVGGVHSCAIEAGTGELHCFGYNADGRSSPPTGTGYSAIASTHHSCALRSGSVGAWRWRAVCRLSAAPELWTQSASSSFSDFTPPLLLHHLFQNSVLGTLGKRANHRPKRHIMAHVHRWCVKLAPFLSPPPPPLLTHPPSSSRSSPNQSASARSLAARCNQTASSSAGATTRLDNSSTT